MSKKGKRKLSVYGMILIAIAFIVVVFLLVLLLKYLLLDRHKTEYKNKTEDKVSEVKDNIDEKEDYDINIIDYKYYVSNDTNFNFVIASVEFKNNSIVYSFDDFVTEDKIALSNTDSYLTTLKNIGIYPNLEGIITKAPEKVGAFDAKIFIPVKNKDSKTLKLSYLDQEFELDLTKNLGDISTLVYTQDEEITDDETFKLKITGVENLTGMYMTFNNQQYEVGSQRQLYGLICDVDCLTNQPFLIESAYFEDANGYVYFALGSEYKSHDVDNLVGLKVLKSSTGAILFELLDTSDNKNTLYSGKLHIKLNNDANEYIINVNVN